MLKIRWIACLFVLTLPTISFADWPQWLGPNRDGTIPKLTVSPWKGELKPLWKKEVGEGNSSPVIADGRLFLHVKGKSTAEEVVIAFDLKTGDEIWRKNYDKTDFKPLFGQGPRATPCIAGETLFTFGNTGVLAAWNVKNGEQLWKVDTLADLKAKNLMFGVSASPVIDGDNVIVAVGGEGALAAYSCKEGKLVWKAAKEGASYASPVILGEGKSRYILNLSGANLFAATPAGEVIWKTPFVDKLNESATTPVKCGDIHLISSITQGSLAIKVVEKNGKPTPEILWKNPDVKCYFSTPVAIDDKHAYLVTGMAALVNASVELRCLDITTGKEVWKKEKMGEYHACLSKLADGKLLLHSDNGELKLLAPNAGKYEELATSKICGKTWAHPAFHGNRIYVRDNKELICLELP